jgi:hypothetical protein
MRNIVSREQHLALRARLGIKDPVAGTLPARVDTWLQATNAAIDILASAIESGIPDNAANTLLDAIYYLRSGHYPGVRRAGGSACGEVAHG